MAQTAAAQRLQFGYNNDYLGYFPMPGAANPSHHGLLAVNLEYTNEELMFSGLGRQDVKAASFAKMTPDLVDYRNGGARRGRDRGQARERQVVGGAEFEIRAPHRCLDADGNVRAAAGHPRLQTKDDPTGRRVFGMVNNCAGGMTPWGTWLTCEENVNFYFWGKLAEEHPEARNHKRMGIPGNGYAWGKFHDRFNVSQGSERSQPLRLDCRD